MQIDLATTLITGCFALNQNEGHVGHAAMMKNNMYMYACAQTWKYNELQNVWLFQYQVNIIVF